jgi:hypothetical protein
LNSELRGSNLPLMGLSDCERAILDFERSWWMVPGSKTAAIRADLGLSPTRYYKVLNSLMTSPDAYSYDPLLVRRLRRVQAERRRARVVGRPAMYPPGR